MSLSIKIGNFLYKNAYVIYQPLYSVFKRRQDAFEIALLRKRIAKSAVVLDIGANIGFYAAILSRIVGENGCVHCFEPDLINFRHLQNALKRKKNVVLNQVAVGPRTEKLKIYTSRDLNVDHRTYKPEAYDQEIEIDALRIDDYLKSKHISKIDLIKMDIQGFEMEAIKGMESTLSRNPDIELISEFWPYGLKKAGSSVTAYYNFLREKGFTCYLLENRSLTLLRPEKVKALEPLGESQYFNILATRGDV